MTNAAQSKENLNELLASEAIDVWKSIIGEKYVIADRESLDSYAKSCSATGIASLAVIKPANLKELEKCVAVARQYQIPLFPISAGKNWGYGSRSPSKEASVLLELGRMNRIVEVNSDLAYAVIEPGVSQQQLYEYLESHQIPLMLDVTGAAKQASLVGNLSERGSGLTPYADHFAHCCGLEVLLGDGRLLRTGFARFENARSKNVYRWGLGPYLDGLFTQSNFGIITKITIWLMPKPECYGALLVPFRSDDQLVAAIGVIRDLKLKGLIQGAVHIANDVRVISSITQYPYDRANRDGPLDERALKNLRSQFGASEWNLIGGLWGSKLQVKLCYKEIKRALAGKARVLLIRHSFIAWLQSFSWVYKLFGGKGLEKKISILNLLKGIPTDSALRGAYWRKRTPMPEGNFDPDRDNCGLMWCSPIVPLLAVDLEMFLKITRRIMAKYKLETNVTVSLIAERSAVCTVAIAYDRDLAGADQNAKACQKELLAEYVQAGYYPYRLSSVPGFAHEMLMSKQDNFGQVCRELKQLFDPAAIIAPGKYGM